MKASRRDGPAYAMLVVRLMLGSTFMLHGAQKVFGAFDGPGLAAFSQGVTKMGMPAFMGSLAALFEFFGGVLVFLGIVPELGALMIVPVMLVAVFVSHWSNGYFSKNHGYEYAFNLLLASIAVILGGGGKLALWDPLRAWRQGGAAEASGHGQDAVGIAGEQPDGDPES